MPQPSITNINLKITCLKFHSNLPGANEFEFYNSQGIWNANNHSYTYKPGKIFSKNHSTASLTYNTHKNTHIVVQTSLNAIQLINIIWENGKWPLVTSICRYLHICMHGPVGAIPSWIVWYSTVKNCVFNMLFWLTIRGPFYKHSLIILNLNMDKKLHALLVKCGMELLIYSQTSMVAVWRLKMLMSS